MIAIALLLAAAPIATPPGEDPVEPYVQSDANAGAVPFAGNTMWNAFGGRAGVARVVDSFVALNVADPRISDIFKSQDLVRIRRVLKEQFCYLLGGGCGYSGQSMAAAHKDLGIQMADMNAVVENLQVAMARNGIPFGAQTRLLAKLAPMKRDIVVR